MASSQSPVLPILPLPKGTVLFPGIFQRVPATADRPDVAALVASIYARAAAPDASGTPRPINAYPIVCVPMASPYMGPGGQKLIDSTSDNSTAPAPATEPGDAPAFVPGTSSKGDLFAYGVVAKIVRLEGRDDGEFTLHVEGRTRCLLSNVVQKNLLLEGEVDVLAEREAVDPADAELLPMFASLKTAAAQLTQVLRLAALLTPGRPSARFTPLLARRLESFIASKTLPEAGLLADFLANIVSASYEEKLQVLAAVDVKARVAQVTMLIERQVRALRVHTAVPGDNKNDKNDNDKTFIIVPSQYGVPGVPGVRGMPGTFRRPRNGMPGPMFRSPPAGDDDEPDEIDELQKKLHDAQLSAEAAKVADKEMKRLRKMVPAQAEYTVVRSYLETLAEIPWTKATDDRLGPETLGRARLQLDGDHYGLDKVKKRLLEYLAVLRLKQSVNEEVEARMGEAQKALAAAKAKAASGDDGGDGGVAVAEAEASLGVLRQQRMTDKSPILLLVGPPGVGKTSLARSVAASLGRQFHRISLGGVRDEAEIRGHRRTYVAAMPGLIIQGLRKAGVSNPVMLLDEIDKIGTSNHNGDPSAAMLEVLDPEQNHTFVDHYVSIPYDLSKVLFIATANSLDTIPEPLLDRMETIHLPGYTTLEKKHIAMQYLVPKQIRVNGLTADQVGLDEAVVSKVIESYTREAGVRNLERELGSVCRAKAVQYAEAKDSNQLASYRPQLTVDDLEGILGSERYEDEIAETNSRPGLVTGLVAYSSGGNGSILFIEVADMPGTGRVQLTGKLGDVLKESVEVALSWVKAHAFELGLARTADEDVLANRNVHVHCPSGAVPKDGPSSGAAQAIALISLLSGRAVRPSLAMTGELTLRGRVTAVGGIKEKLIGALRAGVKTVLLPAQNRKDVRDLPQEVKDGLEIVHIGHIWEAIHVIWPDVEFPGASRPVESRL